MQPKRTDRRLNWRGALMAITAIAAIPGGQGHCAQEPAPAAESAPAAATTVVPSAPAIRPQEPAWELRPYRVTVELTVSPSSAITDSVRRDLSAGLAARLEDDFGSMWTMTFVDQPATGAMPETRMALLDHPAAKAAWHALGVDKVLCVAISESRGQWSIACREWDQASETISPVSRGTAIDERLVIPAAAAVVKETFRALAQVDAASGKNVTLRLRAGELVPPAPDAVQLATGNLMAPFVRAISRKGELQRVQTIPWTLLRVEELDRAKTDVLAWSIYPAPVSPTKKRLESLAIEVRPTHSQTVLQVVQRSNRGNPLAAARVEVVDKLAAPNDPTVDRLVLRTDRDGKVAVPADATPIIRYAIVSSGTATLARVPFCPGIEPLVVIDVMDDMPRLAAEGEISLLEADLIELVARRKVLLLRADAAAKAGRGTDVRNLVTELKALPTQPQFQQRVDLARTSAVEETKQRKDQVAEARIRKMFAALSESSKTFLDDEKFQEQLKDLEDVAAVRAPDQDGPFKKRPPATSSPFRTKN